MQYQTFPDVKGGSKSLEKLAALRLPNFQGKRFLDVGCNEGFFCGYALFKGASRVVGIDRSASALVRAEQRFPNAEFRRQSWDTLPQEKFDVITLLSALHYAEDQAKLIHRLMDHLDDDGLLVLELSLAPGSADEWIKVKRSIDERFFPTRQKLGKVLEPYAWKIIGHSVNQAGDPLQRYVVHVRKMQPYVYLLMGRPGSGKSTISRRLFRRAKIPVVSGDRVYLQISQGKHEVSDNLRQCVQENFSTASIDKVTRRLCEQGLMEEVVSLWILLGGVKDFAMDSFVPEEFQDIVRKTFSSQGYFPVDMHWSQGPAPESAVNSQSSTLAYRQHLAKQPMPLHVKRITVTKLLEPSLKKLLRWHLDSPTDGELFSKNDGGTEKLKGWVVGLNAFEGPLSIYVDNGECVQEFSCEQQRKDVLKSLFGNVESAPTFWRNHPCGFVISLPREQVDEGVELGVMQSGKRYPLARLGTGTIEQSSSKNVSHRIIRSLRSWL